MSEESGTPAELETLPWHKVWWQALTKPSVKTYERFIRDPNANPFKAVLWVFIAAMIVYYGAVAVLALLFGLWGGLFESASFAVVGGLCFAPLGLSFVNLAVFVVSVGAIHLIARALGGTGTYSQMLYAFGAFSAPFILLTAVANLVPTMQGVAGISLVVFRVFLSIRAVQAVHGFREGKAFASTVPVVVGVLVLVAVIVIATFTFAGPTIGNVFSNIVQDLEYGAGP